MIRAILYAIRDAMADEDVQSDTPTPRMQSWARNSTIYRLGRQMLTEKQLFDAISRKAKQKFEGISQAQIRALADLAVKFGYDQGGLNDVAYAEISVRSGVRSGRSKRIIAQKLSIKGVDRETAVTALEESDDLAAAIIFARKRAFGPFRRLEADEKRYAKEMSAFARNGFGFEMGRSVLGMSRDEAETLLAERQS
jgi:regulatory protein